MLCSGSLVSRDALVLFLDPVRDSVFFAYSVLCAGLECSNLSLSSLIVCQEFCWVCVVCPSTGISEVISD